MAGTGTGPLVGPAIFLVLELDGALFLRPMLAAGRTLEPLKPGADVYGTYGAMRLDACLRLPGLYVPKHGLHLEGCGGADLGFLHFDAMSVDPSSAGATAQSARTIPYLGLGPSLAMRGELAGDLVVEVRGVALLNVIRETFYDASSSSQVDPPLFAGRAELGLSWRWR
jgi:hypothetical protein